MRSLAEIAGNPDAIVLMLNDRSGLWEITPERTKLLKQHYSSLSPGCKQSANEMLERAKSGEKFWRCKGEYYSLLEELRKISLAPSPDEVGEVLALVISSSRQDKVEHREWVKRTISLLTRMSRP